MANKIQTSLFLEGKSEYNQGLKEIASNLKALKAEMKLNAEQFKNSQNSAEALSKKSEILSKEYEQAGKKVELYSKYLQELREKEEAAASKVEVLSDRLAVESAALEQMKNSGTATNAMIGEQQKVVSDLQRELQGANQELSQATIKENQVEAALNNATAEQIRYGAELDKTNAYLDEAEKSTDGLAKSIDGYGKEVDEAGEQTKRLNETLQTVLKNEALKKIGEEAKELLDNLAECAEVAEQFGYSMAKVQSIAQVSGAELENMSDDIRRVATEMGYSASEVAEATYQAISASVDAAEAVGFVEDTTKLARAGFTEVTTAVDVLTTAVNAYGKEANTTAHIADNLITTQNLGKTTVDELAQSLGTIIPTASAYNVSLDQLSSAYVILTRQGINTANATTYLRGMLNELADGGSAVADILLTKTGKSFGELMSEGKTLGDVLQILGNDVNGNSEAFSNLFGNIRAGQGALAIFNQGADEFNRVLSIMGDNAGATDQAFAIMADTAVMVNERLNSSVENLKISIGQSLSPALDRLKEMGIGAIETITAFVDEHPKLVAALAGAAAGLTATTVAVTGLAAAIAIAKAAFGDFSGLIAVGVVGGLAATAGAIGGLTLSADKATDSIKELTAAYEDNIEASRSINQSADDFLNSTRQEGSFIDDLKARILSLNSIEELSTAKKKELRTAVNELNALYPDLNLEIDAQTGKLAENTEGWERNLDTLKKREQLKYIEEELSEIYRQQAENDRALYQADVDLDEIKEERAKIDKELSVLQERTGVMEIEELSRMEELYMRGEELNRQEEALTEVKEGLNDVTSQLAESEKELTDFRENEVGVIEAATDATGEYVDAAGEVVRTADEIKAAEDAKTKAIEDASNAIRGQVGLFEEWNGKSDLTLTEMQKRWNDQNDGIRQYTDDLEYIKQIIDSDTDPAIKSLAQTMGDLGVGSAGELHNFVTGLQEIGDNQDALRELADTWQEHIDAIQSAEDLYAGIQLQEQGYVDESQELFDTYYAKRKEAQEAHNTEIVALVTQGLDGQRSAIEDGTPELAAASKQMAEETIQAAELSFGSQNGSRSTVFYNMGLNIPKSLADGISAGAPEAVKAINSMANSMKSALSSAINEMRQQVSSGLAGIQSQMSSMSVNVNSTTTLAGDANQLFRVMQHKSTAYKEMTGQSAF